MKTKAFDHPTVVSPDQWLVARRELLREEKEFTRLGDRLTARRRALPWVKIEKSYTAPGELMPKYLVPRPTVKMTGV